MTASMPDRRRLLALLPASLLAACTTEELNQALGEVLSGSATAGGLTSADAAAGIRAALDQGIGSAITRVGRTDGFFADQLIRIALPDQLEDLRSNLSRFGLSGPLDDLRLQLNRGAETAAPQARSIFTNAVRQLSIADALGIVNGGPTSATDYFRRQTTPALTNLFRPVMTTALQQTGAIKTYDDLSARLSSIPLAPRLASDGKQNLIDHGVRGGLNGLFTYIGREEAAIRENAVKRSSEILRRVFG